MRRHTSNILFLIGILFATMACGVGEKMNDPAKKVRDDIATNLYDKKGLSFSYPDNWKVLDDETFLNGLRYVSLEDDHNSVFHFSLFAAGDPKDLDEYAEKIKDDTSGEIRKSNISEVKKSTIKRMIGGKNLEGIRHQFSISVRGEQRPYTSDFFQIVGSTYAPIIMIESPDDDWVAADKEFQIILDSLKFE